jgi:hypothetical protein
MGVPAHRTVTAARHSITGRSHISNEEYAKDASDVLGNNGGHTTGRQIVCRPCWLRSAYSYAYWRTYTSMVTVPDRRAS